MITIKLNRPWLRLEMTGHAKYSEKGTPDIVCAAASMLSQTLIQMLEDAQGKGECQVVYEMREGYVRLQCQTRLPYYTERIYTMFDMAQTGFRLLQDSFPEHVKFEEG